MTFTNTATITIALSISFMTNRIEGICLGVMCNNICYPGGLIEGDTCSCNAQCGFPASGIGCCNGICEQTQVNYDGGLYCPYACKAGASCPAGSCNDDFGEDEACSCHEQCAGYPGTSACCNGKCKILQVHFDGGLYCPYACQAGASCPAGSCNDNFGEDESCSCHEQCERFPGTTACCNGQCKTLQVNYDGGLYCPYACKASANCPAGSCPGNLDMCSPCVCDDQCLEGLVCSSGVCTVENFEIDLCP